VKPDVSRVVVGPYQDETTGRDGREHRNVAGNPPTRGVGETVGKIHPTHVDGFIADIVNLDPVVEFALRVRHETAVGRHEFVDHQRHAAALPVKRQNPKIAQSHNAIIVQIGNARAGGQPVIRQQSQIVPRHTTVASNVPCRTGRLPRTRECDNAGEQQQESF